MFSACAKWMDDWVTSHPPEQLYDKWDFEQWMESEMIESIQLFLETGFHKTLTKIDAIEVIRSLCWNYYQVRQTIAT